MKLVIFILFLVHSKMVSCYFDNGNIGVLFVTDDFYSIMVVSEVDLTCKGLEFQNVSLTAYYPIYDEEDQDGAIFDMTGKKLRTLQVISFFSVFNKNCNCGRVKQSSNYLL